MVLTIVDSRTKADDPILLKLVDSDKLRYDDVGIEHLGQDLGDLLGIPMMIRDEDQEASRARYVPGIIHLLFRSPHSPAGRITT